MGVGGGGWYLVEFISHWVSLSSSRFLSLLGDVGGRLNLSKNEE